MGTVGGAREMSACGVGVDQRARRAMDGQSVEGSAMDEREIAAIEKVVL